MSLSIGLETFFVMSVAHTAKEVNFFFAMVNTHGMTNFVLLRVLVTFYKLQKKTLEHPSP